MRKIQLSEMAPHVHSFSYGENKVDKLSKWLISWIVIALKKNKIHPNDLLPSKAEFACHIGVSLGTMQNVFRLLEDAGYIESKQKVGSYIKGRTSKNVEKLTSKKDMATEIIKKYLKENKYEAGDILPSSRKLAEISKVSNATVRTAISNLVLQGILEKKNKSFTLTGRSFRADKIEVKTLVEKVALNIKKYIIKNLNPGDKLPPSKELAKICKVSVKTIHDAVKTLSKDGIVYTRRGRYGTIVLSITEGNSSIIYNYEKIENNLKVLISSNYEIGQKLPPIKKLAIKYSTSEKTVKKALDNLADDGYVMFMRGRYGGTFITDIPPSSSDSYTWLAINSEYINNNEN